MSCDKPGNVQCILCKDQVNFLQAGKETFLNHLKSKHDIVFNQDLVMAVNFLDKETTQQIVENFDSQFRLIMNSDTTNAEKEISPKGDGKESKEALLKEHSKVEDDIVFIDGETDSIINTEDDVAMESDESKRKTSCVCSQCNETFSSKKLLLIHVKNHKSSKIQTDEKVKNEKKSYISCGDKSCNETFSMLSDLIKHKTSVHKKTEVSKTGGVAGNVCPTCDKVFVNLKTHIEDIHETGNFPCPKCQKVFTSKNKRASHISRNCRKSADLNKTLPTKAAISKQNLKSRRKSTGSVAMFGEKKMKKIKAQVFDKKLDGKDKNIKENLTMSRSRSSGRLQSLQNESRKDTKSTSTKAETVTTKGKESLKSKSNKKKHLKKSSTPKRRSGAGEACPTCQKVVTSVERHTLDMHTPGGHFPCPGCKKVFSSKNKQSSHTSRNCNPKKVK